LEGLNHSGYLRPDINLRNGLQRTGDDYAAHNRAFGHGGGLHLNGRRAVTEPNEGADDDDDENGEKTRTEPYEKSTIHRRLLTMQNEYQPEIGVPVDLRVYWCGRIGSGCPQTRAAQ